MKKRIAIYGAGGLGREVLSLIHALDEWEPIGFIDDGKKKDSVVGGLPVLGGEETLSNVGDFHVVIAVGDPALKQQLSAKIRPDHCPVLIHPLALLQNKQTIELGTGTIITAGCVLTTDIKIGKHTLLNLNSTVGHDCMIGDYCSLMPGVNLAGEVEVGEAVLIGAGSNVRNQIRIGDNSVVGMGSVVIQNVAANTTVAGVPAKPIQRK
jgi:sugar O-acyltransferase (sialic acid O-acetyltransferase NeuD family)